MNQVTFDPVANLASFLMEKKGSVLAMWKGKLTAKEQRELFGAFLGKGEIWIDGEEETVMHVRKVCYGEDYDCTFDSRWHLIGATVARKALN